MDKLGEEIKMSCRRLPNTICPMITKYMGKPPKDKCKLCIYYAPPVKSKPLPKVLQGQEKLFDG